MLFSPDDDFYDDPDLWDLPDCAMALFARAGAWPARNGKAGFVPASMPPRFTGDPDLAMQELVSRGLWKPTITGFQFTDWARWTQPAGSARVTEALVVAADPAVRRRVRLDVERARTNAARGVLVGP